LAFTTNKVGSLIDDWNLTTNPWETLYKMGNASGAARGFVKTVAWSDSNAFKLTRDGSSETGVKLGFDAQIAGHSGFESIVDNNTNNIGKEQSLNPGPFFSAVLARFGINDRDSLAKPYDLGDGMQLGVYVPMIKYTYLGKQRADLSV
jgi:hypothetical protein